MRAHRGCRWTVRAHRGYRWTVRAHRRRIELGECTDLVTSFHLHRFGPLDPTFQLEPGRMRQAVRTSDGPAAVELVDTGDGRRFLATAIGPGAPALIERAASILGADDRPGRFEPRCEPGRRLVRAVPGLRLTRAASPVELLIALVLQQRVAWRDAARSWRQLIHRYGTPGPGGLVVPPSPATWAAIPVSELAAVDVERKRADTVRRVARLGPRLLRLAEGEARAAEVALGSVAGLGPWTIQNFLGLGMAEPDAVPTGDYDLPHRVATVFRGAPRSDDDQMLTDLAPYQGQRWRVVRLVQECGVELIRYAPKRGGRPPRRR